MSWTDERVELLKKLWGEGKTAAEIAKELGGVTRNAVIGKAHRLKLSNRVSPIQQNKKVSPKPVEDNKPVVKKREQKYIPPITGKKVSMSELRERMCRWPNGDPQEEDFSFCGGDSVPGLPYCEEHAKIAYQSSSRARVLQAEDFEDNKKSENDSTDGLKEAVA